MDINLKGIENNLVTQSNKMVQNAQFSDEMTMRELKILLTVVSMIEPSDDEFKLYKFKARELFDLFGLKKNTPTTVLRETAENLMTRYISIPSENSNDFTFYNLISICRYVDNVGTLEIKINSDVKPFLLKLKGDYTSYKLLNILTLKSEYSIILYQYFKSYLYVGEVTVSVDDLKIMLFGDINKYPKYSLFKRDLLNRVLKEVNGKTDLKVEFTEIKEGRSVKYLKFTIKEKASLKNKIPKNNIIDNKMIIFDLLKEKSTLHKVGISEKDLEFIYKLSVEIWKDNDFSELITLVDSTYSNEKINKPVALIKAKLKEYKENVDNGLPYNHNDVKRNVRIEQVPEWFNTRNEKKTTEEPVVDFEEERKKLLEKLKGLKKA